MRSKIRTSALLLIAALLVWDAWDLAAPVHSDLRDFDAHAVARMETGMWRSYYDHRRVALFSELATLLRTQYHLPFWRSWVGAYHGARAAVVFQRGRERADYEQALPDLRSFYKPIRAASNIPFDTEIAARLELEWWIDHRRRAATLRPSLAALQAEIYQLPANRFVEHADARAEAMLLRDARAEAGDMNDADWARIGALLDTSWTGLKNAVAPAPAPPLAGPH
jgi:hypothetical protein